MKLPETLSDTPTPEKRENTRIYSPDVQAFELMRWQLSKHVSKTPCSAPGSSGPRVLLGMAEPQAPPYVPGPDLKCTLSNFVEVTGDPIAWTPF